MIRVMIVDDHEIVRLGLTSLLNRVPHITVVAEANNGDLACMEAEQAIPDVIVMDIRMPGKSGIEACREILDKQPQIKVLMLTSYADEDAVAASIMAGAKGYVLKQIGSQGLIEAIEKVMQGESLIPPEMIVKVWNRLRGEKGQIESLTDKEKVILALIGQGKTNKEIAKEVFLGEKTVRNYVSNILQKLNFSHRSQAAVYAVKNKLDKVEKDNP
ncbi:response regulator transcription factor [Heliorestis acidaminivorans]|uniref:Stage 0 sporulation protein A homolog n=1 Tax=Heliorestis acidaminivorans TaxID=553427 RepID=A0A6I0F455_9FIRM|nr:response regulator transcription factor [Heliorestis acidaminivorans]KAB2954303.1 response regulator transcription factor [Heliorestis acidaminivorans]